MKLNVRTALVAGTAALAMLAIAGVAVATVSTVVVKPTNLNGWVIEPDGVVPYSFVAGPASIGSGSLQVGPIAGVPGTNKFVMFAPYAGLVSELTGFSYDFYLAPATPGGASDAAHFYVNLYVDDAANGIGFYGASATTSGFYDCRYDSAPATGTVGGWTANSFSQTSAWTNVANRTGTCPATLAPITPGSTVRFIAVNGGDSSSSDAGVMGGYDNVVISTTTDVTTYDFEPTVGPPASKDACKDGGWQAFDTPRAFQNQGDCVSFVNNGA